MNHKRGRPKNRRAGCLFCKPQKANGADGRTFQERREDSAGRADGTWRSVHRRVSA